MELAFIILSALVVLIMIWTVWHLNKLEQRLKVYNDYVNETKEIATESVLSDDFLNQLRNQVGLQLVNTIKVMDKQLKTELTTSYRHLVEGIEQEAAQIINGELEQYRKTIAEARQSAANVSKEAEKQLIEVKDSIQKQAQAAVHEEKQLLMQRIDAKISDVIVHYLVEALGENIDLGSQKAYILAQLEANKEAIKKDINDEF